LGDAHALASHSFHVKHPSTHPLYSYPDPVAPALAARRSGKPIDIRAIASWVDSVRFTSHASTDRHVVVETAGGVFSPVGDGATNYDIALALDPAIWVLVASNRLGVLHDVGSCLRALAALGRSPDAIVLSAPAEADASTPYNADELRRQGFRLPVIELPRGNLDALGAVLDLAPARAPSPR
jgi:dethiobiotin synthetase